MAKRVNGELLFVFSLIVVLLEFGMVFAFGAVFVALLEKYQRDRSSTATLQSIFIGVTMSCGVVSGVLITKLGLAWVTLVSSILVPAAFTASFFATKIEHLYISIGLVSGIGISLGYVSAVVVVSRIFTRQKRVLCLSVQTAFGSLSGLIYPYVFDWLIGLYGLNGTFLILGAIYSNKFPFFIMCWKNRTSLILEEKTQVNVDEVKGVPQHQTVKEKQNLLLDGLNEKKKSNRVCYYCDWLNSLLPMDLFIDYINTFREMMNTTFVLLLFASGISIAGFNGYLGLVLDICLWKGFSNSQGLLTFVILNITNTLSRLVPGILKRKKGVDSFIYPIVSTIAGCIGQLFFYFGKSYTAYMAGTCLTGLAIGGVVSSHLILAMKVVRPQYIPVASGLLFTVTGVISVATGPVFGSFRDDSGSYGSVLFTIGTIQAIAAIFFAIALIYRRIDSAKKKKARRDTLFSITVSEL